MPVCMCVCVHVCMCVCVHVCMCACVHVCMCVCVHVCAQGVEGWTALLKTRAEVFPYLRKKLVEFAAAHGERVMSTPGNPVRALSPACPCLCNVKCACLCVCVACVVWHVWRGWRGFLCVVCVL